MVYHKESDKNRTAFLYSFKCNCLGFLRISVDLGVAGNSVLEEGGQDRDRNKFLVHTYTGIYDLCQCLHREAFDCRQILHSIKNYASDGKSLEANHLLE